jgi:hypothetical protein
MAQNEYTAGMDAIMQSTAAFLKGEGFRKSARNFNRTVGDGLVQVLNFQMGRYEFDAKEIPGLRYDVYGMFTVNLGVLIPSVLLAEGSFSHNSKKVVNDGLCSIRTRLGHLTPAACDTWWKIYEPFPPKSAEMLEIISQYGLPFLDQFRSYQDVIGYYETKQSLPGAPKGRDAFVAALTYHAAGNREAAASLFNRAKELADKNQAFVQHVATIEARLFA